jgi:transcriptional regulator with XRE-family HTH domain
MNEGNEFRLDLWLYNEMKKRGLSISDLAEKSSLSYSSIQQYINRNKMPTLQSFGLILKALGKHIVIEDD